MQPSVTPDVQNLNHNPVLPLGDHAFDAALAYLGVQCLQQLLAVFAEVLRVLVQPAPFVVSFSNRCFPTKAVAIWRALGTRGHAARAKLYLERAGFSRVSAHSLMDGITNDLLMAVVGHAPQP